MSHLALVTTGGTIASRTDEGGGAAAAIAGDRLLAELPDADRPSTVEVVEVCRVNGWDVTPDDMVAVAVEVRRCIAEGADGVVVTHGTDTLEETAFAVDLFCRHLTARAPIVFTGAMRAADEVGADGLRNLVDAMGVATDPGARGRGVLVVVHDEIHRARWVTKSRTTGMRPFRSLGGPIGQLVTGRVAYHSPRPDEGSLLACPGEPVLAEGVHVVMAETGGDGSMLTWALERGARGIVLVGTGAGNVPGTYRPAIDAAIDAAVPVVVTSRCLGMTGPIYGGPGGNATLLRRGVLDGRGLSPGKARLAVMAGLGRVEATEPLRTWMARL